MKLDSLLLGSIKVLLVGLLIHFFVHTVVSFGWDFNVQRVWVWKEIVILFLGGLLCFDILTKWWKLLPAYRFLWTMLLFFSLIRTVIVSFGFYDQTITEWLVAIRYDYFPFIVFLILYGLSWYHWIEKNRLLFRLQNLLKVAVWCGLIWYLWLHFVPDLFSLFWYSLDARQWVINESPPARYLTNVWRWYIRGQWLFGWPVSRGFYLIAFWPLILGNILMKHQSPIRWQDMLFLITTIVVAVVTFSRVVWFLLLVWSFLAIGLVILLWYKRHILVVLSCICLWVVSSYWIVSLLWPADVPVAEERNQWVWERELSDKWHMELLLEGIVFLWEKPLSWRGAGASWPASYRVWSDNEDFFNTENQYLQLWVEWWVPWLLLYLVSWLLVFFLGVRSLWGEKVMLIPFLLSFGLLLLFAAGMLHHSLVDVQVIYSLMIVLWVFVWNYTRI